MQIQFATKKVMGAFEAALIVDGAFKRSGSGQSIADLFVKLCGPLLAAETTEGTEIAINIAIVSAVEAARLETSATRQRETAAADAEAKEIEALTAAVQREQAARLAAAVVANT